MISASKICVGCGQEVLLIDVRPGGCVDCRRRYMQAWKATERGQQSIRDYNANSYKNYRAVHAICSARRRAKQKGVAFDLDQHRDNIQSRIDRGICELTGLPFNLQAKAPFPWDAPSLDRIKPERGYVLSNVRVILYGLNAALGHWGEDVLNTMVEAWLSQQKN